MAPHTRILVVDDDESSRRSLRLILGRTGYAVEEATTGRAALQLMRESVFHAVLLDLKLPDTSGATLIAPFKQAQNDLVIIIVTGHASLDTAIDAVNSGASAYVTKPVEMETMLARLRELLTNQQLSRENERLYRDVQRELAARQLAEASLARAYSELEELLYSISHDLKAPLVTCQGFARLLQSQLRDGDHTAVHQTSERIERAATQMSDLINGLLAYGKIGKGAGDSDPPEPIDVEVLLHSIEQDMAAPLAQAGARLHIERPLPPISAPPRGVRRVFENLLSNAVNHGQTPPETRITIGSAVNDHETRFFVRDHGKGIALQYQKQIFRLFQQVDRNDGGSGIGLAVVSKIMQDLSGRVWVESQPGQGATFWLAFPASGLRPEPVGAAVSPA